MNLPHDARDSTVDEKEANARDLYDYGAGSVFACKADPRFAYCTYVPRPAGGPRRPLPLAVVVHGTYRTFMELRNAYAEFCKWNHCAVLCPLFPIGVLGDGNRDGYKDMAEGDIRYDRVLLAMVDELAAKLGCDFRQFALAGYSGGGQFVNKFALLHPQRLWAASIGAPGVVTRLDPDTEWWVGTRGMQERFGIEPDLPALRKVPVHLVVGKADLETWEITFKPGHRRYMPGANDAGATRVDRIRSLKASFEKAGIEVQLDIVPNLAHDGLKVVGVVQEFLAKVLAARIPG